MKFSEKNLQNLTFERKIWRKNANCKRLHRPKRRQNTAFGKDFVEKNLQCGYNFSHTYVRKRNFCNKYEMFLQAAVLRTFCAEKGICFDVLTFRQCGLNAMHFAALYLKKCSFAVKQFLNK